MSSAPKRVPTFDELYREIEHLPQGMTGQILIPGVLTTMSRPGAAHHRACSHCRRALDGCDQELDGHGWWIRQEFEVRFLGDRLAVPDLAGWRADLHPELPDDNPLRIIPTWCAEVLSPSTASDDRTLKLPLYASTGVAHIWLIDPTLWTIEVYEATDARPTLVATARDAEVLRLPPFDVELSLAAWWKAPSVPAVVSP
ncbi:MAG TPA: Uma2 family endonuclease [Polyangiaceae bacterium]